MDEYGLDTYIFDAVHDMGMESDYNENGELSLVKNDIDLDNFIDNLKERN